MINCDVVVIGGGPAALTAGIYVVRKRQGVLITTLTATC